VFLLREMHARNQQRCRCDMQQQGKEQADGTDDFHERSPTDKRYSCVGEFARRAEHGNCPACKLLIGFVHEALQSESSLPGREGMTIAGGFHLSGDPDFLARAAEFVRRAGQEVVSESPYPDSGHVRGGCLLVDASDPGLPAAAGCGPCVALARDWDRARDAMRRGAHDACLESEGADGLMRAAWRAQRLWTRERERAEEERTVRLMDRIAPFGSWDYDATTGRERFGARACAMLGLDPGTPNPGAVLRRMMDPEELPHLESGIRLGLRRGRQLDTCFKVNLADGRKKYFRLHAEPRYGDGDRPAGLRGVLLDNSETYQAEAGLERSRTQLLEAQLVARIGSWEMQQDGEIIWSEGVRRILECDASELHGGFEAMRRFVHPEDRDIYDQANRAVMDGWPLDFEYRVLTTGGELRFLQVHRRVELNPSGKVARAFGIARDITSQKRFEQALEKRDSILQAVSGAASRFLRQKGWEDELGRIIEHMGRSAKADTAFVMRNHTDEDGRLMSSLVHEWSASGLASLAALPELQDVPYEPRFARWQERLGKGRAVVGSASAMPASEREFFEQLGVRSVVAVPILTADGLWGILGLAARQEDREWLSVEVDALHMAADIFGSAVVRGMMEEELLVANLAAEEAKVLAEEASKAKSRFLANMSHEIRTPISGIIGLTEMTITTGLKPEQRQNLDMIRDAARSLLNIINDVLDLSKIEADKMRLAAEDFDVRKTLGRVVNPHEAEARAKGLELALDIDESVPGRLRGDSERLGQIVRNLLSNAVKFTQQGHVEMSVRARAETESGTRLLFRVEDTGPGIPHEQQEAIFESFTQADDSSGKRHQGTGLGLAICRELVEMMGGTISLDSVSGRGTEFRFDVLLHEAAEQSPEDASPPDAVSGAFNLRLLLVEDNLLNQKFLTHFLTMFGHEVEVAGNGLQGLEALRRSQKPFDLVLMDIQMPEMDGVEATRIIRESDGRRYDPEIPIIALTAYAMKGDRDRMLEAGMNDYVTKPVDMEKLSAAIARNAVRRRRGPATGMACTPPPGVAPEARRRAPVAVPGTRGASEPVRFGLDVETLERRFEGNEELLSEILDIFLREADLRGAELRRAMQERDARTCAATLHAVANLVSHVHALETMERARKLEIRVMELADADAQDESVREVYSRVSDLLGEFAEIVAAVSEHRKTL